MLNRREIEEREIAFLAPYAIKARFSKGRKHKEEEHAYRTAFQRDKDRIIFSSAFRRLQYKTQVFSNFEGDYYRTRLTHTLEVSQIARSIARSLRLNEDLAEAIALAHDLGHGPFGHIGESILNECMMSHGGFEHNAQSLRIVEELEDIYVHSMGLNLTYETREGLMKHTFRGSDTSVPISYATLEAQVVDIADEIAYDSHDLDDGLTARLFEARELNELRIWQQLSERIRCEHPDVTPYQRIRLMIRYFINEQVTDLLKTSESKIAEAKLNSSEDISAQGRLIIFSDQLWEDKQAVRAFLHTHFYQNTHVMKIVDMAEECIRGLFTIFSNDPSKMPKHFYNKAKEENRLYRVICDYIAGMTDRYAFDEFRRLRLG